MMRTLLGLGVCAVLLVPAAQDKTTLIAFRVDDERVLASVRALVDDSIRQFKKGEATSSVAKFGYPFLDLPEKFQPKIPTDLKIGDRWAVHTSPGQVFHATAERFVLGQGGCENLLALVLKIDSEELQAFRDVRTKYYVADVRAALTIASPLGPLPDSAITPKFRARLETTLGQVFALELPRVRLETAKSIAAMATSEVEYHRSWARERRSVEAALALGAAVLTYDTQAYRLTPDGVPLVFVRARWHVGSRLGFAAAFWVREDSGKIVWQNLRPASWLRTFEFQGEVHTQQLGLVMNVVDRDRDGWAEVIFLQGGYEGVGVEVLDVSADGLKPAGISYSYGC